MWTSNGRSRRALFVLDAARVVRFATVPDEVNPEVDAALAALESFATPAA